MSKLTLEQTVTFNRKRDILSALWIFLSVNYILCDVLSNMEASVLRGLLEGNTAGIEMNQGFLLMAGISLEIPFVMIVIAKVLKFKANKIINITAGLLMTVYQASSFFFGTAPSLHYIFFSGVEIIGNLLIVILAWKWVAPVNDM
ncbi:MAG: DUF6326 family protein [Oscillospiraceae bacterium]